MSKRKRKMQQVRRVAFAATWPNGIPRSKCPACGEAGPHYAPPGCGDEGFYLCTESLLDGRAVGKVTLKPVRTNTMSPIVADALAGLVPHDSYLRGDGPNPNYMDDM